MSYLETLGKPRRVDPDKPVNRWPTIQTGPVHTTQAGAHERMTSKRPTAAPVVDADQVLVALDITPHLRPLLRQVIQCLRNDARLRLDVTTAARIHEPLQVGDSARVVGELAGAVAKTDAALIILDQHDGQILGEELSDAALYQPEACRRCDNYTADDTTEFCESHREAVR